MLRAHCWAPLQARGAQAKGGMHQTGTARGHVRCWLHCRFDTSEAFRLIRMFQAFSVPSFLIRQTHLSPNSIRMPVLMPLAFWRSLAHSVRFGKLPKWTWSISLFAGVWGGLLPRIIMIGTLTALQWFLFFLPNLFFSICLIRFIYDFVKVAFHIPRPPPPEMPESLKAKLKVLSMWWVGQSQHFPFKAAGKLEWCPDKESRKNSELGRCSCRMIPD